MALMAVAMKPSTFTISISNNSADMMKLALILPEEIPTDHATRNETLKAILDSNTNLYMRSGQTKKFKLLDFTFPKSYASELKDDTAVIEAIIGDQICQKVESVEHLILPELAIDTVKYLVCEKKIFDRIIAESCRFIDVPFSASPTISKAELDERLIQITEALIGKSPALSSVDFKPDSATASLLDIKKNTSLKKKIKEVVAAKNPSMELMCNGFAICKGDKQLMNRKRPRAPDSPSRDTSVPGSKKPKTSQIGLTKKPSKLKPIPANMAVKFTFDSFPASSQGSFPTLGSHLFTAYNYWQLEKIHGANMKGANTTIAIVDSGIDPCHPAFGNGQIIGFHDFCATYVDPSASTNHGTLSAGIVCGNHFPYCIPKVGEEETMQYNEQFPAGVAPEAKLVICKVLTTGKPNAIHSTIVEALQWIFQFNQTASASASAAEARRIDVVSLSLGSLQFQPEIAKAVTDLVNENVIVVCAASNNGYVYNQPISFPARLGNVLCIGSHGPHGKPSPFSPVGREIDFLAPGENITGPASIPSCLLTTASGTSYATPAVAGLICLIIGYIKEKHPEFLQHFQNHWVMKEILQEISGTSSRSHSSDQGFGALDPLKFFQQPEHVLDSIISRVLLEN